MARSYYARPDELNSRDALDALREAIQGSGEIADADAEYDLEAILSEIRDQFDLDAHEATQLIREPDSDSMDIIWQIIAAHEREADSAGTEAQ